MHKYINHSRPRSPTYADPTSTHYTHTDYYQTPSHEYPPSKSATFYCAGRTYSALYSRSTRYRQSPSE
jgi:hypothetical protein